MVLVGHQRDYHVQFMTGAVAFDTHRFVRRLTDRRFTERQAKTLAGEHVALLNGNLATKADIETLRQETGTGIAQVEARIAQAEARVEASKSDHLKWLYGAMIARGGLMVALVKILQSRRQEGWKPLPSGIMRPTSHRPRIPRPPESGQVSRMRFPDAMCPH